MPVSVCPQCQTRYRVADAAIGKQTACKKCGHVFRIAAAPAAPRAATPASPRITDVESLSTGQAAPAARPPAAANVVRRGANPRSRPIPEAVADSAAVGYAAAEIKPPVQPYAGAFGRYVRAVAHGATFVRQRGDLATFIIVWGALAVQDFLVTYAGCFGLFSLVIAGWYAAFLLKTVVHAAAEEDALPGVAEDGWWDGVIVPFFRMSATMLLAALPAIAFYSVCDALGTVSFFATVAGTAILGLLGLFIWPMLMLVVSCGGSVWGMFRLDLIATTVFRSFPAYLLAVLTVYLAFGLRFGLQVYIEEQMGGAAAKMGLAMLLLPILLQGPQLYFDIVAMRAIGSYYACFKHRFAWSWD